MVYSHFNQRFQHCFTITQDQLKKDDGLVTMLDFSHDEEDTILIWFWIHCRIRFENDIHIDLVCNEACFITCPQFCRPDATLHHLQGFFLRCLHWLSTQSIREKDLRWCFYGYMQLLEMVKVENLLEEEN